ncbi:hypothetical protein ACFSSB_01015 [Lacinutrix gracilariae]|uniref:DUF3299 domain-containing protein n=1 Tax=Lacinutrix gracilariae TaxID=1747198 RepID=A0ABW5JXJ4_9FLAO
MKNKVLLFIILLYSTLAFSQQKVTWEDLSNVKYTEKYFHNYDEYFKYPTFLPSVMDLEGKQIKITGYFFNIAPEQGVYILSKTPMSSCFFCGQGEPNTVIELQCEETPNFKTDAIVSVTGKLRLNSDDVEHFNFIIENCIVELTN